MAYTELILKVNPPAVEIASDFVASDLGFEGVVTEETYVHLESPVGIIKAYAQEVTLSADEIARLLQEKRCFLKDECGFSDEDLGDWECTLSEVQDESWADNWKNYWDVQKIGERTIICPSWLECTPQGDEIKIELDPGSAFGTGTHPTTRLCIVELEKYVKPASTVVDVGCGSGILSIVAKKLGTKEVFGVDIDPESVRVSIENAQINTTEAIFEEGTAYSVKGEYDIVVANILAHVIVDIMPELKRVMAQNGVMILSGIIEDKAQDVLNAMAQNGVQLVSRTLEPGNGENWVCLVGKK